MMKLPGRLITRGLVVLLLGGLLLAACAPGSVAGPVTPTQQAPGAIVTVPPSTPTVTPETPAPTPQPAAVTAAQQNLAGKLNIPLDQIKVISKEAVEWPDSCLGFQNPGEMCAQMVTPGYRIILEEGGKQYEYHANQDGSALRLVEENSPTGQPAESQSAVAAAQQELEKLLGVTPGVIQTVNVEPVDWPDGCLGVEIPGTMCTQVITPGYRVVFDVYGLQYEYHTDETGSAVVPAAVPFPQSAGQLLVWEQTENGVCNRAEVGPTQVSYGPCGGSLQATEISGLRSDELVFLVSTYTSFTAGTKAGTVQFQGAGSQEPGEAEKRSVAEWAYLVFLESQSGRSGAAWGLAFTWHREGGIAGFCDDLGVYLTGWAMPTSCKSGPSQNVNEYRLSADELAQMYTWIDQYENFSYEHKDAATADAMLVQLDFSGGGSEQATTSQQEQVAEFAATIFTQAMK